MKNQAFVILGTFLRGQCFWSCEEFFFVDVFNAKNFMQNWIEDNISVEDYDRCEFSIIEIASMTEFKPTLTLSFNTSKTTFKED